MNPTTKGDSPDTRAVIGAKFSATPAEVMPGRECEYLKVLADAKRKGPTELSNGELVGFCKLSCDYVSKHRWINEGPFFQEVFRRVENHLIPGIRTQADACRQIGISVRWAQMILSGTAKDSNKHKANKKRIECEVSSHAQSDDDLVSNILRYADSRLRLLASENWDRYRSVCDILENFFAGLDAAVEVSP
jgi:hypothetical protein